MENKELLKVLLLSAIYEGVTSYRELTPSQRKVIDKYAKGSEPTESMVDRLMSSLIKNAEL